MTAFCMPLLTQSSLNAGASYDRNAVCRMYRDMGLSEIGHLLSCQRDATFCEGYDKRMRLKRTQTIMQGASHCDFHYALVDEPKASSERQRSEGISLFRFVWDRQFD
jgi:L-2-amino-thiazoline-4-carboxylic acid hydrolase-like protein